MKANDNGVIDLEEGTIKYIALPVLPSEYRAELIQLGTECNFWRMQPESVHQAMKYKNLQSLLEKYIDSMRRQFGIKTKRAYIPPVARDEAA